MNMEELSGDPVRDELWAMLPRCACCVKCTLKYPCVACLGAIDYIKLDRERRTKELEAQFRREMATALEVLEV